MKQWYKWTFADGYCVITRFSAAELKKEEKKHGKSRKELACDIQSSNTNRVKKKG